MEFLLEVIFGTFLEIVFNLWTNFMKKINPDYDNSRSKKVLTIITGILLIVVIALLIFGIIVLIDKII